MFLEIVPSLQPLFVKVDLLRFVVVLLNYLPVVNFWGYWMFFFLDAPEILITKAHWTLFLEIFQPFLSMFPVETAVVYP